MRETPGYSGLSWAFAKQVTGERVCFSGCQAEQLGSAGALNVFTCSSQGFV